MRIESAHAAIEFGVDAAGRLVQRTFGGRCEPVVESNQPALPAAGDGWVFEPAIAAIHADGNTSTDLVVLDWAYAGGLAEIRLKDSAYPFFVDLCVRVVSEGDVFEMWTVVRHEEPGAVTLDSFASSSPSFDAGDYWLTQFHGDWANEANLSEEKLGPGIKILDSKLGVRAHQFRAPWFLLSRGGPSAESHGEVFGGSLAWSGSFRFAFETLPTNELRAICGISPFRSAYHLEPGDKLETPKMAWAWSGHGAGELSRKLQRYMRNEVLRDGNRRRAIVLNNWEATHFNFDEQKIVSLFAGARDLGMELFLLDDGWFGRKYPRDDDTQGLGDWMVDVKKLPNGLEALTSAAKSNGLRFGLWFEPEMVNPDSELFEKHPEWLIQQPGRAHELQRSQMVLDLANPEVRDFAFHVLHDTLAANPGISYVKWDCNRYLTQPGSPYLASQSHVQIEYVRSLYWIMAKVAALHPDVEIMMCSGGGGRVDYGAMRFAHEVWPSDMTDPVRRIFIQWGFSYFFPAIAVACHVTRWGERPLKFAFDVAMSGKLGMDVDLDKLSAEDRAFSARAIATYKSIRDTVQFGDLYRLESPYDGPRSALMYVHGRRAVAFVYSLGNSEAAPVRLSGLDDACIYRIRELNVDNPIESTATGADLMRDGLPQAALREFESRVFELSA